MRTSHHKIAFEWPCSLRFTPTLHKVASVVDIQAAVCARPRLAAREALLKEVLSSLIVAASIDTLRVGEGKPKDDQPAKGSESDHATERQEPKLPIQESKRCYLSVPLRML